MSCHSVSLFSSQSVGSVTPSRTPMNVSPARIWLRF
jgi:hypothetical protein